MKRLIACFLMMVSTVIAKETVDQIIADAGLFVYSDGSSFFAFHKGGRFESGPMGISGRTIEGTWTMDQDGRYVVKGKWGWINGISVTNDFRTMSIHLSYPHDPSFDDRLFSSSFTNRPVKIHKAYALIDSLEKDKDTKPQPTNPSYSSPAAGSKR